jgi:hypothetical protein
VLLVLPPTDHLWIGRNRGNSRVISAMQIDDQRVREDARGHAGPRARAAYPRHRSSNANGLRGENSAGFSQIYATFQRDNLRRHF